MGANSTKVPILIRLTQAGEVCDHRAMKQQAISTPSLSVLVKLGSIVVHADELFSPDGRDIDKQMVESLLRDPEVVDWIREMGALLPLKRVLPTKRR